MRQDGSFVRMEFPKRVKAGGDLRLGADDDPIAVPVNRTRPHGGAVQWRDVHARAGEGIVAGAAGVRSKIPGDRRHGTEYSAALSPRGHFHTLAALLKFEVLALQIAQQGGIVGQKQMGVLGDGTGGQTQGLNMVDLHEAVDGTGHVCPVHEGVSAGDHDFFDGW